MARVFERFDFVSDACAKAGVTTDTEGSDDDPVAEVVLHLIDGMFDVRLDRYSKRAEIYIRARDHGDGEIGILAASLRWLANELIKVPGYHDIETK